MALSSAWRAVYLFAPLLLLPAFAPRGLAAITPAELLHEAKGLCFRIRSVQSRAAAFAELALRYDLSGSAEADRLWQLAEQCAIGVDDPLARVLARRAVLARMVRSPVRREGAKRLAAEILAAASKLAIPVDQALALRELASTVAAVDAKLASDAFAAAAKAAARIPEALVRASAQSQIARAMVMAGVDSSAAAAVASDAEASWRAAKPSVERDLVGVEVAGALALVSPKKAHAVAEATEDVQVKARAYAAIARALARRDVAQALLTARAIADANLRALALAAIAVEIASSRPDLAARLARDAIHSSGDAPAAIRDLVLQAAAPAIAPTDSAAASSLLREISDEEIRAEAAVEAAKIIAPTRPSEAVKLLDAADAPQTTEPAWPDVLYWYARTNPDDAHDRAGNILERYLRLRALLRIWDALAGSQESAPTGEK